MDNNSLLQIKFNAEDAIMPKRGSPDAAGYDLYTNEAGDIEPWTN